MAHHQVDPQNDATPSRRQLIASLLAGGAVVASAPFLASSASAEDGATPTTAPPHRDPADNAALNAALEREARMAATYAAMVNSLSGDDKAAFLLIHDHHVAYAQSLKGYLGTDASSPSETPLAAVSGSVSQAASQLAALEEETVTIHTNSLVNLRGINAAMLISSIITVEARHAVALNIVAGTNPIAAA